MNLIYWKSDIGNLGDDLNPWLWERIFGDFSNYSDDYDFVAIGSILTNKIEDDRKKIIFGSGIRDFLYNPNFQNGSDVRFVRGPVSSKVFNNAPYITDAAYCLGLLEKEVYEKKYETSYIPYFRQVHTFDWKSFEKWSGMKVILPTNPIEQVIKEINESKNIIASAMHGAILADIYRIPWIRARFSSLVGESTMISELKWFDWHKSIGIDDLRPITFGFTINYKSKNFLSDFTKGMMMINKFKKAHYFLSDQSLFEKKINELKDQVEYIKDRYIK
ncbi:polysaccharide pyruvyl transferase family protein [Dysgonomonas sp. ZJ709]|uniref:polysaccharide pyruvyl transferase family protein n=1 Tax=Dysgonomonas sp. ZJ709 TaxID=2709797 RepID=UPI0013EBE4E8|nr:polysaccharide pyruvyl transferase family protein [Dysgonomonas sp. ZJ709]